MKPNATTDSGQPACQVLGYYKKKSTQSVIETMDAVQLQLGNGQPFFFTGQILSPVSNASPNRFITVDSSEIDLGGLLERFTQNLPSSELFHAQENQQILQALVIQYSQQLEQSGYQQIEEITTQAKVGDFFLNADGFPEFIQSIEVTEDSSFPYRLRYESYCRILDQEHSDAITKGEGAENPYFLEQSRKEQNAVSHEQQLQTAQQDQNRRQQQEIQTAMEQQNQEQQQQRQRAEAEQAKANAKRANQRKQYTLTTAIKDHISIVTYAAAHGLTVQQIGRQWTIKEMDSIRINPDPGHPDRQLFYRHSTNQAGSVIDFAMMVGNQSKDQAIRELRGMLPRGKSRTPPVYKPTLPFPEQSPKRKLTLPKAHQGAYHRVYAYLNQTRGIDGTIINEMIKNKLLYEDASRHNCVFVGYDLDGKPGHAFKHGTYTKTDRMFKGEQSGSRKEVGWSVINGSSHLIVTEGSIDALSVMTMLKKASFYTQPPEYTKKPAYLKLLQQHSSEYQAFDYLSLNGVSTLPLQSHLQSKQVDTIYVATDNDPAGTAARDSIKHGLHKFGFIGEIIDLIPQSKDMNQDLQNQSPARSQMAFQTPQSKQPAKFQQKKQRQSMDLERMR